MMKKLTFDELENTLDREEMRNIMAGSGGSGCATQSCFNDAECTGSCYTCNISPTGGAGTCSSHF